MLQQVGQASTRLAQSESAQRSQALVAMAQALRKHQGAILEANTLDLEISREMTVPELVVEWLNSRRRGFTPLSPFLERLASLARSSHRCRRAIRI